MAVWMAVAVAMSMSVSMGVSVGVGIVASAGGGAKCGGVECKGCQGGFGEMVLRGGGIVAATVHVHVGAVIAVVIFAGLGMVMSSCSSPHADQSDCKTIM